MVCFQKPVLSRASSERGKIHPGFPDIDLTRMRMSITEAAGRND